MLIVPLFKNSALQVTTNSWLELIQEMNLFVHLRSQEKNKMIYMYLEFCAESKIPHRKSVVKENQEGLINLNISMHPIMEVGSSSLSANC